MKSILIITVAMLIITASFQSIKSENSMQQIIKKVNVWDTYVTKKDGGIMHFDIIAPVELTDTTTIYTYGRAYLKTKGQEGQSLASKQCRLCHIEALKPSWEKEIDDKGYFIIEMEGCD